MVYTYNEYLPQIKSIDIETCLKVHEMMADEIGKDNDAIELYDELVEKSIEYTIIRALWTIKDRQWKTDHDSGRSAKHNSVIIKFNQLARYLKAQGKSAEWRDMLGYEEDEKKNRKKIGDMACFLTYVHGVNGR